MGCRGSKLEEQEAVALCRGRADLLAAALRHRYALADAHAALADSLASFSGSLHLLLVASTSPSSPRLSLPPSRKTLNPSPPHPSAHLQFGSSSGSESGSTTAACSPRHHHHDQVPLPPFASGYGTGSLPEPAFAYPQSSLHFYYARSRPPPASVAVEQRVAGFENVYVGSLDPATSYPQFYSYGYGGESAPPARQEMPPPSPPRANTWDFLNVFENYEAYDNYYYDAAAARPPQPYTPSRSSREVREEEGIPELEEEEDDERDVVVKEVASEYSTAGSSGRRRSSVGGVSSIAEIDNQQETAVVEKEVVGGREVRRRPQHNVAAPAPPPRRVIDAADVAGEIKAQFVRAADAAKMLAPMLEVGRRRYHPRSSVYHVSSRMVSAIAPHSGFGSEEFLDIGGGEKVVGGRSLSLTLQKLYIWERKLYDEVKAEEKMRLLLAKNSKRLKFLDQKGAEAHKIDATRNLVRKLSTKIRIAVRVIAKISKKINKVRDEELWPQINALIQGFVKMWQEKLECYQIQCQVISEAKNLDSIISSGNGPDCAMELELELIKWIVSFSSWVNAQRNFVKALNGWLALCLNYKPEETADGVPPYSPGRMGAPPVFVICNSWSQAMDRISERDVVNAMQALVSSVQHLWEQQNLEQSEQVNVIRERERWIKMLERKALEINKEVDALNRKLALVPGQQSLPPAAQMYEAHFLEASSLQISLRVVLQALENFAANSLHAFEEILRHAEEDRLARENAKVP